MNSALARVALGVVLGSGLSAAGAFAEEGAKALPTLLIKGEVVSLDTADPAASLLKVKDRYGFETPIFLTTETKVTQQDGTEQQPSNLAVGTQVEVEYNFDVNTAKRHAVSVKIAAAPAAAPAAEPAAAPAEPAPAPAPEPAAPAEGPATPPDAGLAPAPEESQPPAAPAESAPSQPEEAAPAQ